jgi:hypothetical protein
MPFLFYCLETSCSANSYVVSEALTSGHATHHIGDSVCDFVDVSTASTCHVSLLDVHLYHQLHSSQDSDERTSMRT